MNRRHFLITASTLVLGSCSGAYGPALINPCTSGLPERLARHDLVLAALEGIDGSRLWDGHVHLLGTGDGGSGIWINPHLQSMLHPAQFLQFRFYLNAACADPGNADSSYLARLLELHGELPAGSKLLLLAFDYSYDKEGRRREELSAFHTPNDYAASLARLNPQRLEWVASVHPYRKDCVEAVHTAARQGARAVKWLPPAMGIDPASPLCDPFYDALTGSGLPLLVHAGEEKAVHGAARHEYGNPLLLRRPLDRGVRVIVAHCASLGESIDIDESSEDRTVSNFELFVRLMEEKKYEGRLYGEISAMTQVNRVGPALDTIITRQDWHHRLVNGSDYPLPAVMPLFSPGKMTGSGYITREQAEVLGEIRRYNALLFDLLLKRMLRVQGLGFQDIVFHSRRMFDTK